MSTPLDEDLAPDVVALVSPVGPLQRLRATEPVRLWLCPVAVVVLATLALNGAPWVVLALAAVASVFLVRGLRSAVYSERTWDRDLLEAHRAGVAQERERGLTITTRAAARQLTERFPL